MMLYLVQHGEALAADVDPDRPLSDGGREAVGALAAFLAARGLRIGRVRHSGKLRAAQTAEILAEALADKDRIKARDGLAPKDPVEPVAREAAAWDEDVMLVGHMPFMARLAALLVTGDDRHGLMAFRPGSLVCLARDEADGWSVAWMLRPDLLGPGG